MIVVSLSLDRLDCLRSCRVHGHAGAGRRGQDPVCAALSVLVRTAARILAATEGISVEAEAEDRGSLEFSVVALPVGQAFLAATTAFLVEGLTALAAEFPSYCTVEIERERRLEHGS